MSEYDDGFGDTMDMEIRILGMEALRILETTLDALAEAKRERARVVEREQEAHQARWNSHAILARRDLDPVMRDDWWPERDLEEITARYVQARAFAEHDESFVPYRERIEAKAKELRNLDPEQILQGPVPPGPRPMTEEQAGRFMTDVAPSWYKAWAGDELKRLDRMKDPAKQAAALDSHNAVVRADFEHFRDTGTLSEHAKRIQDEWLTGDRKSWVSRRIDPKAPFAKLSEEQRRGYGWRPGGAHMVGPLGVDDARLIAATQAPKWYRLQEQLVTDVPPAIRERLEGRLVEDMTALRDTGRLDTASAREEWARFSGHPVSVQDQDPNESLAEFRARREREFGVHWALTEHDRERVSSSHGDGAAKPMSVPEAELFAERYAPEWLKDRHREVLAEHAKLEDPDRVAFEQTNTREQFRYAMEHARDTGTLSHPYVANLRDRTAFMGLDESDGMAHVPPEERVRFGGPETRPITADEAREVMAQWAPEWYRDAMNRTLREDTELSESARRQAVDQMRADMTQVRDHGVLDTDHAMRVWAASRPGFDPSDPDSRKALDAREATWVATIGERETPQMMDANNRARFGGKQEAVTQPIPVIVPASQPAKADHSRPAPAPKAQVHELYYDESPVPTQDKPQVPQERPSAPETGPWKVTPIPTPENAPQRPKPPVVDTVDRREKLARDLTGKGFSPGEVDGAVASDYERPGRPGSKRGGRKPAQFEEWVEQAKIAHQAKSKGPDLGR